MQFTHFILCKCCICFYAHRNCTVLSPLGVNIMPTSLIGLLHGKLWKLWCPQTPKSQRPGKAHHATILRRPTASSCHQSHGAISRWYRIHRHRSKGIKWMNPVKLQKWEGQSICSHVAKFLRKCMAEEWWKETNAWWRTKCHLYQQVLVQMLAGPLHLMLCAYLLLTIRLQSKSCSWHYQPLPPTLERSGALRNSNPQNPTQYPTKKFESTALLQLRLCHSHFPPVHQSPVNLHQANARLRGS